MKNITYTFGLLSLFTLASSFNINSQTTTNKSIVAEKDNFISENYSQINADIDPVVIRTKP